MGPAVVANRLRQCEDMKILSAFLTVCGLLSAQATQAPNPTQQPSTAANAAASVPVYRVTVVARTTKAINYNHRSGATNIGFRGTALMPQARGEAKVESKQGVIKIDARMQKLEPATKFGAEYLTYVMWAITPEGRATNVGEVLLNGENSKLDATTELQSFGLIVTAEPYFAVTQPSDVVIMENFVTHATTGTIEEIDAKYELLQRGQYVLNVNPSEIKPVVLDRKVPLELYEARNAVQIARWTGAQEYAGDTYHKAVQGLENAEGYLKGKAGKKPIGTVAREAVQMAEDARIITIKKIAEDQLRNERLAAADRESRAEGRRVAAQSEAERVTRDAETARVTAQADAERVKRETEAQAAAQRASAKAEAERVKRENEAQMAAQTAAQTASAQAEAERLKREADAKMAAQTASAAAQAASAQAAADRLKQETDAQRAAAQADIQRAGKEKAEAEAARAAAVAQQQAAQAETETARRATEEANQLRLKAETEKTELRSQLLRQFNLILETRDTARGLIVNMTDVLFDTAKFSLRPVAREKLAKVSGIVLGHPGLKLDVEGHTDSVGSDDYNQRLSEQRGGSVRDYLVQEGIPTKSVTSKGFGKTQPVASNDTVAGRQRNRRVELVISGEVIGTAIGSPTR
jgi:outer membrane protein OmpA-like peptidoglycan-associated protein